MLYLTFSDNKSIIILVKSEATAPISTASSSLRRFRLSSQTES